MANNIEVKTPLDDRPEVERRLVAMAATNEWTRRQRDTFYAVPRGWLKLREADSAAPELISYQRTSVAPHLRESAYDVLPLESAVAWHRLLGRVLDVDAVVEKERTLWLWRQTRVHLDRVLGLGQFLELETVAAGLAPDEARAQADEAIRRLGLDPARFLDVLYRELLARP